MQPQNPGEPVQQNSNPNPMQPQVYSPGPTPSGEPGIIIAPAKPSRRKLFVLVGAAVVLVAALAAYAFAYYLPNKPENVWRSALDNTSKGYQKLLDYAADDKLSKQYEVADLDGTFAYSSDGLETDGTLKVKSDDKNATFSGDLGIGLTRVNFDGVVKDAANSDSPDMYVKVDGIKGLGSLAGIPQLDALDSQWITLDHTFFDSFVADEEGAGFTMPSKADVVEAAEVVGKVSDKYLFTTNKADAVLDMREYVGTEKLDGKDTKHFKVKANKANLKRYLEELGKELDKTKLNDWAEETFDKPLSKQLNLEDAIKAADDLKGDETFDAWVNTKTKLLHKVRFTDAKNPKDNYLDLVLNYDGGNTLPFSLTTHGKDAVATLDMSVNMDTNVVKLSADMEDGAEDTASTGSFDFTIKPGSGKVEAEAPEGAISLLEALSLIGLDEYLNLLTGSIEGALQEDTSFEQS
jgi:hypothetical protein